MFLGMWMLLWVLTIQWVGGLRNINNIRQRQVTISLKAQGAKTSDRDASAFSVKELLVAIAFHTYTTLLASLSYEHLTAARAAFPFR